MVKGEVTFRNITSLAVYILRSSPFAIVYGGLSIATGDGLIGLIGVYIILLGGVLNWELSAAQKWEGAIILVVLAAASLAHAIGSLWIHPVLSISAVFTVATALLNRSNDTHPYVEVGHKYWPTSIFLIPFGLIGLLAIAPFSIIISVGSFISWLRDFSNAVDQSDPEDSTEKRPLERQENPHSELEEIQQSQQTADEINTRRPSNDES